MPLCYMDNIHSIRKEIRTIEKECKKDMVLFNSVKRILISNKNMIKAADNTTTTTRDVYEKEKPAPKPTVQMSALENMSKMLHDRQERQQLAEHILFLLKNNFANEDGVVIKKLTELSQQLVDQTTKLAVGADAVLNDQGNKLAPPDFKKAVTDVLQDLAGQLNIDSKNSNIKYYAGVDKIQQNDQIVDRLYNMGYIEIKNFKSSDTMRDIYVVVTRRINPRGDHSDFIRTFYNYVNPTSLMKNNIGTEFKTNNRAVEIVMRSLKMDKLIDSIDPSQIPIKKENIKISNNNIDRQKINEKTGTIHYYLKDNITTSEQADKVLQEVFVQIKNLIKSIHPRNRNPVTASVPKQINVTYRNKKTNKQTTKKQYTFRIQFSKPENKESLELPREKVQQFMKILDLPPSAAMEFNKLLKNFIGINTKSSK